MKKRFPKRIENRYLKKYLYPDVHSSIVHSSYKVETTQMSMNLRMEKRNVVHAHNAIVFRQK